MGTQVADGNVKPYDTVVVGVVGVAAASSSKAIDVAVDNLITGIDVDAVVAGASAIAVDVRYGTASSIVQVVADEHETRIADNVVEDTVVGSVVAWYRDDAVAVVVVVQVISMVAGVIVVIVVDVSM